MPKNIKVMHCLTAVYDGGQETFLVKTFKYIQNSSVNEYDFIICSLSHSTNERLIKKYNEEGIKYYSFNFANRKRSLRDVFNNLLELFKLSKLIKGEKVDILYGHDFFSAMVVRLAYISSIIIFFYKVKRIYISLHILLVWLKKPHNLINKILSYFTDKIICVSNSVFEYSLKHDRIARKKYIVVPNGIDVNEFSLSNFDRQKCRQKFGLKDSDIVLGSVGSIGFRKGQLYFIKAFNEVIKKFPNTLVFIFGSSRGVDKESEYREQLDKLIHNFKLCDKIHIFTPRLDINKIYPVFDVYVMPSVVEGFGLALVEAMSMERIVIASDIPPFKEVIDDGYDGFLFESENYMDLADKIEMVLNRDKMGLKQVSLNARNKVLKKFNSELMGKEYEKLYSI